MEGVSKGKQFWEQFIKYRPENQGEREVGMKMGWGCPLAVFCEDLDAAIERMRQE